MGGLKGVAKRSLPEKSLAVTVNRGRVFPSVNPGACSPFSLPFQSLEELRACFLRSFLRSFLPLLFGRI